MERRSSSGNNRSGSYKRRSDERLDLTTQCRLDIGGKVFDCIVDNISTVGASIDITFTKTHIFQVGETGTLNVLLLSPVRFNCKVVRMNSTQICVEFVDSIPQTKVVECDSAVDSSSDLGLLLHI